MNYNITIKCCNKDNLHGQVNLNGIEVYLGFHGSFAPKYFVVLLIIVKTFVCSTASQKLDE